jgi:hypothetical protein
MQLAVDTCLAESEVRAEDASLQFTPIGLSRVDWPMPEVGHYCLAHS